MTRHDRAREVLAASWAAVGRDGLAESIRAGKDSEWSKSAVAIDAMLAFADAELERAAEEDAWLCKDSRTMIDTPRAIRAMKEE